MFVPELFKILSFLELWSLLIYTILYIQNMLNNLTICKSSTDNTLNFWTNKGTHNLLIINLLLDTLF